MTRPLTPDPNQDPHAELRTVPDADQPHRGRPRLRGIACADRGGAAGRVHVAMADRKSATSVVRSHPGVPRGDRHGSGGFNPGRPADCRPRGADHFGLPDPGPSRQSDESPVALELPSVAGAARHSDAHPARNRGTPTLADVRARQAAYYRRGSSPVDGDLAHLSAPAVEYSARRDHHIDCACRHRAGRAPAVDRTGGGNSLVGARIRRGAWTRRRRGMVAPLHLIACQIDEHDQNAAARSLAPCNMVPLSMMELVAASSLATVLLRMATGLRS